VPQTGHSLEPNQEVWRGRGAEYAVETLHRDAVPRAGGLGLFRIVRQCKRIKSRMVCFVDRHVRVRCTQLAIRRLLLRSSCRLRKPFRHDVGCERSIHAASVDRQHLLPCVSGILGHCRGSCWTCLSPGGPTDWLCCCACIDDCWLVASSPLQVRADHKCKPSVAGRTLDHEMGRHVP